MNKLIRNTIISIGLILCIVIFMLNICVTATISNNIDEKITLKLNNIIELAITGIIAFAIYKLSTKLSQIRISKKVKVIAIILVLLLYIITQIIWLNIRDAKPLYDQQYVYEAAVAIANGNEETLVKNQYLELYTQQLTLATFYALIFKITGIQSTLLLQYLNVIANALTIFGLLLITNQIAKKYEVAKVKPLIIVLLFITLPLLSVFVYGDLIGITTSIYAVYFIMKYGETKKTKYALISMIMMSMAYIVRMNNLIFIIAITIYLILDILRLQYKNIKNILKGIIVILLFIIISTLPATGIKKYWKDKLELDENKAFPTLGFICMGMQEGERAKGWYNQSAFLSFLDVESSTQQYAELIEKRINTFIDNPMYFIKFYVVKTATMWTENTYAGIWYNQPYRCNEIEKNQQQEKIDRMLQSINMPLQILQKSIILIIFGTTALNLIKERRNISNEVLLLITIFIGGFLFHTIWEAKSRYIIPYIVILIPIVSIPVNDCTTKVISKIKRRKVENGENNEIIDSNSNL